jgi:hypothetical protein
MNEEFKRPYFVIHLKDGSKSVIDGFSLLRFKNVQGMLDWHKRKKRFIGAYCRNEKVWVYVNPDEIVFCEHFV